MSKLQKEIAKRRTFAIISHPDAGKTTMTEKLLLLGGAIQLAGTVKARKAARHATSDWMQMEKDRGISVTSSVMKFEYDGYEVNLLDTPGHNDFSEDTYRVLTAVDSALMLIDSAKGVEAQTVKLMNVCRMRNTPIVTFMNKLDREGLDPFELMENVENVLGMDCCPMTWPIGMGKSFRGVYDIRHGNILLFDAAAEGGRGDYVEVALDSDKLAYHVGAKNAAELREELELVIGAGVEFNEAAFRAGKQTPVFFGSALVGFGVEEMFRTFAEITPPPQPRAAIERMVEPTEPDFSGFVFKIQANMDPKHRDRIAFMRVCSGKFERGGKATNVRLGREVKFTNPIIFMAQAREIVEEAYPGDIVGLHDTGVIEIGDTFTSGGPLHFTGIPSFAPEIFRRVRLEDPLGMKKLRKGLHQLASEGAVQLFKPVNSADLVVGVVGALQLDVLKFRLQSEYSVRGIFESVELATARWYRAEDDESREAFERALSRYVAHDAKERPVYLVESNWRLNYTAEQHPKIRFFETSDGYERG